MWCLLTGTIHALSCSIYLRMVTQHRRFRDLVNLHNSVTTLDTKFWSRSHGNSAGAPYFQISFISHLGVFHWRPVFEVEIIMSIHRLQTEWVCCQCQLLPNIKSCLQAHPERGRGGRLMLEEGECFKIAFSLLTVWTQFYIHGLTWPPVFQMHVIKPAVNVLVTLNPHARHSW